MFTGSCDPVNFTNASNQSSTESNASVTDDRKQQLRRSCRRLKPNAAPYDTPKRKANSPNYAGSGKNTESANLNEDSIESNWAENVTQEFESLFRELTGSSSRNSKESSVTSNSKRLTRSMSRAHTSNELHISSTASNYQKNIPRKSKKSTEGDSGGEDPLLVSMNTDSSSDTLNNETPSSDMPSSDTLNNETPSSDTLNNETPSSDTLNNETPLLVEENTLNPDDDISMIDLPSFSYRDSISNDNDDLNDVCLIDIPGSGSNIPGSGSNDNTSMAVMPSAGSDSVAFDSQLMDYVESYCDSLVVPWDEAGRSFHNLNKKAKYVSSLVYEDENSQPLQSSEENSQHLTQEVCEDNLSVISFPNELKIILEHFIIFQASTIDSKINVTTKVFRLPALFNEI